MEKTAPSAPPAAVVSSPPTEIHAKSDDVSHNFGDQLILQPADPPGEILLLDQHLAKDLTCGICLQVISEPRQCSNGHLFCYECLQRSILATSSCPTCRCKLTEETISRSLIAEKQLRSCIVWCKVRPNEHLFPYICYSIFTQIPGKSVSFTCKRKPRVFGPPVHF